MAGEFDDSNSQLTGGVDTGKSVYALLPLGSVDDKERIQSFEGEAIVMNARVVCVSPTLVEGTVSQGNGRDFDGFDTIELNGVLMPGMDSIGKDHIPATGFRITCLAALPDDEDNTPTKQIPLSLCSLSTVNSPSDRKEYWRYLVLRTNGTRADWFSQIRGTGSSGWTSTASTSVSNPWTILHTPSAATFLSLSLCTSLFSFNISHITASTSYPLKEPTIGWNTTTDNHLVIDIATNFRRRSNLFALTSRSQASKSINPPEDLVVASFGADADYAKNLPNNTFVMCTYCYDNPSPGLDSKMKWMHPAHVELAQRLVDNPAIMLQAHFVTLCQSVYYERLSAMRTRRATVVPWVRVSRPIKRDLLW